jgi:hypothetical protein
MLVLASWFRECSTGSRGLGTASGLPTIRPGSRILELLPEFDVGAVIQRPTCGLPYGICRSNA